MRAVVSVTSPIRRALWVAGGLAATCLVVEAVDELTADDAGAARLLTDIGGLTLAVFAAWVSAKPASARAVRGSYRVAVLAALAKAAVRFLIAFFLLYEAYARFRAPPEVAIPSLLVVAAAGFILSPIGIRTFRVAQGEGLTIRPPAYTTPRLSVSTGRRLSRPSRRRCRSAQPKEYRP